MRQFRCDREQQERPVRRRSVIEYSMFRDELERLKEQALLREIRDRSTPQGREVKINGRWLLNFASNDYLGLSHHPALREAAAEALERFGTGAGASRLLSGGCVLHRELEERVAEMKGAETAVLFGSGYGANTGIIPALAGEGDTILSDELNHASVIDGCRLSRAKTLVYRHRDAGHAEELLSKCGPGRIIIATDTVFSMDGSIAPLEELCGLAVEQGALLYLDDAHGTGVLGGGRGALAQFGITVGSRPGLRVLQMGTFSKALGSFGAFAAGEKEAMEWLVNSARSLIYATALPPPVVAASLAAVYNVLGETGLVERLWHLREKLVSGLNSLGIDTGLTESPIVPVMTKDVGEALSLSARLYGEGIYAPAIRPPTVRTPRLRLTVTASHTEEDLERLIEVLRRSM